MSPTLTAFLFETANFLVLAGVLAWLFFKPVSNAIKQRRNDLRQRADETAQKLAEAEKLRTEMEQQLTRLDRELDERRSKSQSVAEVQAEQILKTARDTALREANAAKNRMAHLEQAQREQIARIVAETAGVAIDRLLRQIDHPDLNRALTAAACREIQAFDGQSLAPVRVESAKPLTDADRQALTAALGQASESAEFHVIHELGAGLRVATNRGLVDVSSTGLAMFAEHQLASQLTSAVAASTKKAANV